MLGCFYGHLLGTFRGILRVCSFRVLFRVFSCVPSVVLLGVFVLGIIRSTFVVLLGVFILSNFRVLYSPEYIISGVLFKYVAFEVLLGVFFGVLSFT